MRKKLSVKKYPKIQIKMMFLLLLGSILLNPSLVFGELHEKCYNDCICCINRNCGSEHGFSSGVCIDGCIDGHTGARCYELCQYTNCKACGGNTSSRTCTACYDGYYLGPNKDCTLECPFNCKSCTSGTLCTECKEGFYDKDGSFTCKYALCPENCECSVSYCISCKTGYYNISTTCNSTCPRNCDTCVSKNKCDECKNAFYNGYEYDKNSGLQLNNCTYNCRDTCAKCKSYDNCSECVKGKYGLTCQEDCSVGCKDRKCLLELGYCDCSENFVGNKCTECIDGKYGQYCNQACPKYCNGTICNKTSGYCVDGCISETIIGNTCNTCRGGTYREPCDTECPENCMDSECERYTGNCTKGCKSYFNGTLCDACVHGKYGRNCEHRCPINCEDGICVKTEGTCYTCAGHYHGEKCDTCRPGYFGPNCEEICSLQCAMTTCNRSTGACVFGCKKDYSGDRCCVESEYCMNCSSNKECSKCITGYFQNTCKERCPSDCLNKCDFLTGECYECKKNLFGRFCNFTCSDKCYVSKNNVIWCAKSDGTCTYGCQDGYTGSTCNVTCSNLCIDNMCKQDTGICINGCNGQQDDPVCVTISDSHGNGDVEIPVSAAVLGSLLALSVCINIVAVFYIVFKHMKQGSRKDIRGQSLDVSQDVTYENTRVSSQEHLSRTARNESNTSSAKKTNVYEVISSANDMSEHEYQQISPIATTAVQETRY